MMVEEGPGGQGSATSWGCFSEPFPFRVLALHLASPTEAFPPRGLHVGNSCAKGSGKLLWGLAAGAVVSPAPCSALEISVSSALESELLNFTRAA